MQRVSVVLSILISFFSAVSVAQTSTPVLALDVSHWSGTIDSGDVACWRTSGIQHLVPGTQVRDVTRNQLITAEAGGLSLDSYVVLYWDADIATQVRAALDTVDGLPIRRLWLDVEVHPGARSPAQLTGLIQQGLDACGDMACGIYTAKWWWDAYMRGSSAFTHVPLWYAWYDGVASLDTWSYQSFGGWATPAAKQYNIGTECGVTVDYNVMHVLPLGGQAAPPVPTNLAPDHGVVVTGSSVRLSVDALADVTRYDFQIEYWDGATWQTYYTYRRSGNTQTFWPAFVDTQYRWRARAEKAGAWGGWSSWAVFNFGNVGGVPPVPTGVTPPDGTVVTASSVTLGVSPVPDALGYEFAIEHSDGSTWQTYHTYAPAGNSQTFWPAFDDIEYRFRARAENGFGWSEWTGWSHFDFGTVSRLPAAPTGLVPQDGAVVSTSSVNLSVQPVDGASSYEFEIWYWDGATWKDYFTYRATGPSQRFWPAFADTAFQWRARAENVHGFGDWSEWSGFDFGNVARVPPAPTATTPIDGAAISSGSVRLEVEAIPGALGYEFQITYWTGTSWRTYYTYASSGNAQTFWPYYHDTSYRWRARAENTYGWGAWSEQRVFDYGNVGPPPVAGGWSFPVGSAETGAGWFVSLGLGESWYSSALGRWFRGHLGEDWFRSSGGTLGQPVYAAAEGEVVTVLQNCGNYVDVVILRHVVEGIGESVYSFYGHIQADGYVSVGDRVTRRQQIGVIGDPVDFNPHVHFEIKNHTALVSPPFSGCSSTGNGVYISAGYSGLSGDYGGGTFYDPTDATAGNRYYHPRRFIRERP